MRVLYYLESLDRGGTETLMLDICKNAKKNNLDLVLAISGNGDYLQDFENSGNSFYQQQRKFPIDFRIILWLKAIIKKEKIEIIHTHQAVTSLHAYFASFFTKVKLVQTFHGYLKCAQKDNYISRFLIPRFNKNIVVSNGFLERLKKESIFSNLETFEIIYNGIDYNKFPSIDGKLKEELGLKQNDILIGMISNFVRGKDHITVVEAFNKLLKKGYDFFLVFVGAKNNKFPSIYNNVIKYCFNNDISNKVFFLDKRCDIPNILSSLDYFVFSTVEDTFGIALIEAMYYKIPTFATKISPIIEITNNGKFSRLFELHNSNELADEIELVYNNDELVKKNIDDAYVYIKHQYSIENHINNLKTIYNNILS